MNKLSILGNGSLNIRNTEIVSRKYARRSIVTSRKVRKGEILDKNNLTFKRPGNGIPIDKWDLFVGKKTTRSLPADHQIIDSDVV